MLDRTIFTQVDWTVGSILYQLYIFNLKNGTIFSCKGKLFMMRFTFSLLFLLVLFVSCRKGKTLPDVVYVHYDGPTTAYQYPTGRFSPFDPFDIYEVPQYPSYVDQNQNEKLASDFNDELKRLLEKNNVVLTTEPAEYSLHVGTLDVSESLNRQSYVDSCSYWNETAYVYYSDLDASVTITLKKNGYYINSWTRHAMSSEKVRDKRDDCNRPKIRSIGRGPSSLVEQLARELRVKISKQLYELEVQ